MRYICIIVGSLLLLSCQSASAKKDIVNVPKVNEASLSVANTPDKSIDASSIVVNSDALKPSGAPKTEPISQSVQKATEMAETTITKPNKKEAAQKLEELEEVEKAIPNTTASHNAIPKSASQNKSQTQPQPKTEATTQVPIKPTTLKLDEDDAVMTNQTKKAEQKTTEVKAPQLKKVIEVAMHDNFNNLLKAHVSTTGEVDYAGIKAKQSDLDSYLEALGKVEVSALAKNAQLAFWINAYNAFTIKKVIDNYPLASITDLDGGKPWDAKWIKLNGQTLSLNNIENDIIRPTFKEPRIHFAVNCAAKSCPPLLNKAWTANNLESNFEKQTKAFVNNSDQNIIGQSSIQISKIFEWYGVDFGDIISFLNKYSTQPIDKSATVTYKAYDWALNN